MKQKPIVRAAIHPAIGVSRVGNSKDGFFLAPEVPHPGLFIPPDCHDETGAIKRQVQRFRIYGYDEDGKVVKELTLDDAKITWKVHVANTKSSWYVFNTAMDIPEAIPALLRNGNVAEEDRNKLEINHGACEISGRNEGGKPAYFFDTGRFFDKEVYLGEVKTDDSGRLLFFGGRGESGSIYPENYINSIGNNDGWYDDTSDGPVDAEVILNGSEVSIPVDSAWVISAPVNYCPEINGVVTMYDIIEDTMVQGVIIDSTAKASFKTDIYPILYRLSMLQWTNLGYALQFGEGAPYNFLDKELIAKISNPDTRFQQLRREIFYNFRDPDYSEVEPWKWPWLYGDDVMIPPEINARQYYALTPTQYSRLKAWVEGNFTDDWDTEFPQELTDYPIEAQPKHLDRAAMTYCLGGAFHPGAEMPWIMREVSLYSGAFRLKVRTDNNPEPFWGPSLSPEECLATTGPLNYSGPGAITRWMSVPWQADVAACTAGYFTDDPYIPSFWPARYPNNVLTKKEYERIMNQKLPRKERIKLFFERASWLRSISGSLLHQVNLMINHYKDLGFIQRKEGMKGDPDFPEYFFVETHNEEEAKRIIDKPKDNNRSVDISSVLIKKRRKRKAYKDQKG